MHQRRPASAAARITPVNRPAVRCMQKLATNPDDFTRFRLRQSVTHLRHHRSKVTVTITSRHHRHDRDADPLEILLERDVAVDGEQNIEAGAGDSEQLAVLQPRPTLFLGGANFVFG
jgi:hypothetical protein